MLGNWSLGDYFKADSISMSYDFLTIILNIPKEKIAVTVFEGDDDVPRDNEAFSIWKQKGLDESQIYFYGREDNWWGPVGITGPCGPDTEIFFDMGKPKCSPTCGPACQCGKYVEIWNNVFMEYNKNTDGSYTHLTQKSVDTGMGLERVYPVLCGKNTVYETELFLPVIRKIEELTGVQSTDDNVKSFRIISEHARAATFLLGDPKSVRPSNTEQGYVLRRLIRRAIRHCRELGSKSILVDLCSLVISMYRDNYPELEANRDFIFTEIQKESALFARTLDSGLRQAEKYFHELSEGDILSGGLAFKLYDTFGFPIEFTQELACEKGIAVDMNGFLNKFKEHQEKSRQGAEAKFKGGMADNSEQTTKLHTATHLLNAALRSVLGEGVFQKGSNITAERLRFDFTFDRKLSDDELSRVSDLVNEAIRKGIEVTCEELTLEAAKRSGAIGVFENKYDEIVKVYTIDGYSKEICGGPHASNTTELGSFTILKEESSSSGVRRIRAKIAMH
jgi:alanyl-tRNA synthetase